MAHKYDEEVNADNYLYEDDEESHPAYFKPGHDDYDGSSISTTSEFKKRLKALEDIKKLDKGYHKIYRKVGGNKFPVELYETSYCPGFRIRNAITGSYEPGMKVGTKDEYLFFVAVLSTGETGPTPPHLYYDNPEQYERHFRCTIPTEMKEAWYERNRRERYRRDRQSELDEIRRERRSGVVVK